MKSKKLHNHLLPIVISSFALLMIGTTIGLKLSNVNVANSIIQSKLTTSLIRVKPTKNGLAEITFSVNNPPQPTPTTPVNTNLNVAKNANTGITVNLAVDQMKKALDTK